MKPHITEKTLGAFVKEISDQHYPLSGAVIATSAAQSVALGEACIQISLDNQLDTLNWQDITSLLEQMVQLKSALIEWADQDIKTVAAYGASVSNGNTPYDLTFLGECPADIARLSLEAAEKLQDFRPLAYQGLKDKLDIAIHLLKGSSQAAICLLDCNLQQWNTPDLVATYEPLLRNLQAKVQMLSQARCVEPVGYIEASG